HSVPLPVSRFLAIEADDRSSIPEKDAILMSGVLTMPNQLTQYENPDSRIVLSDFQQGALLEEIASAYWGLGTGDDIRFVRRFWEVPDKGEKWVRLQGAVTQTTAYGGRERILL